MGGCQKGQGLSCGRYGLFDTHPLCLLLTGAQIPDLDPPKIVSHIQGIKYPDLL